MLVVVSPAKNLDFDTPLPDFVNMQGGQTLDNEDVVNTAGLNPSQPTLMRDVKNLVKRCKTLSPSELSSMMKISDKLAILNAQRFSSFEFPFTTSNARPAMFAFNGDVYTGLDANSLSKESAAYAQDNLRILSGLYGVLKPFDLMQAYRLEMGTKIKVGESENLYQYWQNKITTELNAALQEQQSDSLINLASNEYFSSVKPKHLKAKIITPQFKDEKNGKFKIISFYAKKARGLMARYIIEHQVKNVEQLKAFNASGYYFEPDESNDVTLVFKRAEQL